MLNKCPTALGQGKIDLPHYPLSGRTETGLGCQEQEPEPEVIQGSRAVSKGLKCNV